MFVKNEWACVIHNNCNDMDCGIVSRVGPGSITMECENVIGPPTTRIIPLNLIDEKVS